MNALFQNFTSAWTVHLERFNRTLGFALLNYLPLWLFENSTISTIWLPPVSFQQPCFQISLWWKLCQQALAWKICHLKYWIWDHSNPHRIRIYNKVNHQIDHENTWKTFSFNITLQWSMMKITDSLLYGSWSSKWWNYFHEAWSCVTKLYCLQHEWQNIKYTQVMSKIRLNKKSNNDEMKYRVIFLGIYESYKGFKETTRAKNTINLQEFCGKGSQLTLNSETSRKAGKKQ